MGIKKGPISNSDLIQEGTNNLYLTASRSAAIQTQFNERTSYGVVSGLTVAQQTVADMTVKVSSGIIYMASGIRFTPSAVASIAITAADATNPRIDIIYVNSSGVVSYLAGTAGATPAAPALPAGGMLLAEISVAANATTVVTANIADRHKSLGAEAWIAPTFINSWVAMTGTIIGYRKDNFGKVHLKGSIKGGTVGTQAFALPAGYRPSQTVYLSTNSNNAGSSQIGISTGGSFTIYTGTVGKHISLDGISFYTD